MSTCPHCHTLYFEDNTSQPCCYSCGHPFTCRCAFGEYDQDDFDDFDYDEPDYDEPDFDWDEGDVVYTRESVVELYHVTSEKNIVSILQNGLLPKLKLIQNATNVVYSFESQSNTIDQSDVHCYFNIQNSVVEKAYRQNPHLVIIALDISLLDQINIRFTDAKLNEPATCLYSQPEDLEKLPWHDIFNNMLSTEPNESISTSNDPMKEYHCAEILIPNEISPQKITQLFCFSKETEMELKKHFHLVTCLNGEFIFPNEK